MGQAQNGFSPARIFGRPTADQLWLGPAQRRALTFLRTPIEGPTKLLLGPRGCGKSTLLDTFLGELADTLHFKISERWDSGSALLHALLESTDLTPTDGLDITRRNLFSSYLKHQRSQGRRIVIAIDDAERLSPDVWLELYRLRSVRCDDGYEPEFILTGRSEAYGYLQSPAGGGWESTRLIAHTLKALETADVGEYIRHRLHTAGLVGTEFTESARELIGHLSSGSLTSANLLCQMSLVHAHKQSAHIIDDNIVRSARMAMGDQKKAPPREKRDAPAAQQARNSELIVSRGDQIVARYPLAPHMLLGRSEYNHVCLKSNDVSRHHAAIVKTPRGYEIVDLDSANGIAVNGAPSSRHTLSDRDVVALGPYRLELISPIVGARKPARRAPTRPLPPSQIPQVP